MSSSGPLIGQTRRSPSWLDPARGLCPKSFCWSKRRWPCFFRSSRLQTRRGTPLSLSVAQPPFSGSEPWMRGAGRAPQQLRRGRLRTQHVAHVSVPFPTPSAPLSTRRGSGVVRVPHFRLDLTKFALAVQGSTTIPRFPKCPRRTLSVSHLQFSATI